VLSIQNLEHDSLLSAKWHVKKRMLDIWIIGRIPDARWQKRLQQLQLFTADIHYNKRQVSCDVQKAGIGE
jgi:hypothetical protein